MKKNNNKYDLAVGGQALIEGIMMRTPHFISMAFRRPNGQIHITDRKFVSLTKRVKVLGFPVIRGIVGFVEMLVIGIKALNYSAEVYIEEEDQIYEEKDKAKKQFSIWHLIFTLVFSIAFALFIFKFVPLWLTYRLESEFLVIQENYALFNLIDGFIKILFFVAYIAIISLFPDIHRVFQYHGAEHKSIYTYEENDPLIPENAQKHTRFHPRCGTSFILVVFVISILLYTFVPRHPLFFVTLLYRIALLPVIAGISYEFLKWSGKHKNNKYILLLAAPGLWLQRLTTKEPDDEQLEVGLAALKRGLELEAKGE